MERLSRIGLDGRMPRHVAVIMDGNGRWAKQQGLPRSAGHRAGMRAVREVVEGAVAAGVDVLTLYAFSTENWKRPKSEIAALMGVLQAYADKERRSLADAGVEVRVLGEIERLDPLSRAAVRRIQDGTRGGRKLRLNLMISYGGREEIARAARRIATRVEAGQLRPDAVDAAVFADELFTRSLPDPDLLIRTSGEYRISNFMLWQLAYTELYVTSVHWPDFTREDLFAAILDYQRRERRFGRVTTA